MSTPLKLLAQSADDLKVLSSALQDAALKVGDIAYLPKERRLAAVLNRYRWEDGKRTKKAGERVRTGLHFDGVLKAQVQNVPLKNPDHVMELLAIDVDEQDDASACLTLVFSGFAAIRLKVECIEAQLSDLSDPWPARTRPDHALD